MSPDRISHSVDMSVHGKLGPAAGGSKQDLISFSAMRFSMAVFS